MKIKDEFQYQCVVRELNYYERRINENNPLLPTEESRRQELELAIAEWETETKDNESSKID